MHRTVLGVVLLALTWSGPADACSVFNHTAGDVIRVGRNLDWVETSRGRIGFLPAGQDQYGAVVFYNDDDIWPQGGMNDQGLVLGMTATPYLEITGNPDGQQMTLSFWEDLWASCANVEDVLQYLAMFDLGSQEGYFEQGQMLWTDASGASAIVEGDEIIHGKGDHQTITNFLQSQPELGWYPCPRFELIEAALTAEIVMNTEYFTGIIEDAHGTLWGGYTVWSLYYEPETLDFTVYNRGDFDRPFHFNLADELAAGTDEIEMDDLTAGDDDTGDDDTGDDDTGDDDAADDDAGDDDAADDDDGGGGQGCDCQGEQTVSQADGLRILGLLGLALPWWAIRRRR